MDNSRPAILKPDGQPFQESARSVIRREAKQAAATEMRALPVGPRDVLIIRDDGKPQLSQQAVELLVKSVMEANPEWSGTVVVLKNGQELQTMPEPVARKLHRYLERLFGSKSAEYRQLRDAAEAHRETSSPALMLPPLVQDVIEAADALVGLADPSDG